MPDQIYIGNFLKGQINYKTAFNIDNDAFDTMYNFYSWRGRIKRKRGTSLLGILQKQLQSVAVPNNYQVGVILTLNGLGNGTGNLISTFSLGSTASITKGSISFSDGTNTYTEPATPNGTLVGVPGGSGTINYATGAITITGGAAGQNLIGTFSYYPGLPVMGLRDFTVPTVNTSTVNSQYPVLLAFDTKYSYQINSTNFYLTSYYKTTQTPFAWTGQDYQQFWTINYQNALWATNNVPGFHFQNINTITVGNPTTITTSSAHGLITGDWVFFNEITGADANLLNGQAFQITKTGANSFTVAVNTTVKVINNNGIFQMLTASKASQDGIRWYDGDPTGGTGIPASTGLGWVNFAPPLTAATVSINNKPANTYYLIGALAIVPFKDRLVFFSPWIGASDGTVIQLQDTAIWSWNGTPYYNALTPTNEVYNVKAYYVDQTGLGGYLSAGISQPIQTVSTNEDVLLVGFGGNGRKTRFVYTGNDIYPFLFFTINSELPSSSTFSSITLDRGAIDLGPYGIALTDQQSSQRIDLEIPDEVFKIQGLNNGVLRVNAIRDFKNEWIYFSYPVNNSQWKFPVQTFLYNYREGTWAIFYENFTTHGRYRRVSKNTWITIGKKYGSWENWRKPWNDGSESPLYPSIIAGNPQGYVLIKDEGTSESVSGTIQAIITASDGSGNTQITSINHCVSAQSPFLLTGDFLYFSNAIGSTYLNGQIAQVIKVIDANNFIIDIPYQTFTYLGLGQYTRLCQPLLQTKQFPFYWQQGRQTRLGVQKYLMDFTANGQVTVDIYLSQDPDNPWNQGPVVPDVDTTNETLVYSQILYTCPEATNLGLTPANVSLQTPISTQGQQQIWHRMNTSLQGDSIQIGITLSDKQMRVLDYVNSDIVLHGLQLTIYPGPMVS